MKKLIYPIIFILISCLIVINYLAYKKPKVNKIISQNKLYTVLNEQNLYVNLYTNYDSPYVYEKAIESVYLEDEDSNNRLLLNVEAISNEGSLKYLKEKYNSYLYVFSLPKLTTELSFSKAYLIIDLKNGESSKLLIGSLSYYYQEQSNLNISEYYGTKKEDLLELQTISFKLSLDKTIKINNVYIGEHQFAIEKEVESEELVTVNISILMKIVDSLSVKLEYQIDDSSYVEILPYFIFFESHENALDFGVLNNVYTFD